MKAVEANLLAFLNGKKQFIIPIYQRMYSWNLAQCQQLWRDVVSTGKDVSTTAHFIGSVVYISNSLYTVTNIPQLLLIDGQQRLTTLSLLLAALAQAIGDEENQTGTTRQEIEADYLFNSNKTGDLFYKLLLTRNDKETLARTLQGKEPPANASVRVLENYQFFKEQLQKSGIDLRQVYAGISKLILVDISLDRDHDNPQLIFESLNFTGLELSQADLIRNYILMGLEPHEQTTVYEDYWFPMETFKFFLRQ